VLLDRRGRGLGASFEEETVDERSLVALQRLAVADELEVQLATLGARAESALAGQARDHGARLLGTDGAVRERAQHLGAVHEQVRLHPAGCSRRERGDRLEAPAPPFRQQELREQQQRHEPQCEMQAVAQRRRGDVGGLARSLVLEADAQDRARADGQAARVDVQPLRTGRHPPSRIDVEVDHVREHQARPVRERELVLEHVAGALLLDRAVQAVGELVDALGRRERRIRGQPAAPSQRPLVGPGVLVDRGQGARPQRDRCCRSRGRCGRCPPARSVARARGGTRARRRSSRRSSPGAGARARGGRRRGRAARPR
jgi:hypothetical protein